MRYFRFILFALLFISVFYSCNKDLNVNANWKDITIIYGLLDQAEDTTFIKITKAFLGNGDALTFAKIPDSSIYPEKLEVRLEAWAGNTLVQTWANFDTITKYKDTSKTAIFYPGNLIYYKVTGHLDSTYTYWLKVRHKKTGVVDSAVTHLIYGFKVDSPDPFYKQVEYAPGKNFKVSFFQATGGKRYQLVARIHYRENSSGESTEKTVNWVIFNNFQVTNPNLIPIPPWSISNSGSSFYTALKSNIPINHAVSSRLVLYVDYIFSVASDDLNTYMDASGPSNSIVQERPSFSNIFNGIGLFTSRYIYELDTLRLGPSTKGYISADTALIHRGF